jgi:prephenate dehydrogenase
MQWAQELLPQHVSFVGGHQMAGKEKQGIDNADAELFREKVYCICPSVDASETAVKSVVGLAQTIGAEPMFIDPAEHDVYAAAVSHLPLMVASALFNVLRTSPSWPDMSLMASSGLKDTTRLASGDPRMAHDIWVTNREAVIHWLERMEGELRRFRSILQDSRDQELLEAFAKVQMDRDELIKNPPKREMEKSHAVEKGGEALMDMFIGKMMADQLRRARRSQTDVAAARVPARTVKGPNAAFAGGAGRRRHPARPRKLEKKRTEKE